MPEAQKISAEALAANMADLSENYQSFLNRVFETQVPRSSFLDPATMTGPFTELWTRMMVHPEKLVQYQMEYASNFMSIMNNIANRFSGHKIPPLYQPLQKDIRFKDKAWQENMFYDMLRQSYVMTSDWLQHIVYDTSGIDSQTARKISFYTKQFIDAFSPSNFLLTNPEVLRETIETNGENLVRGLKNLREDFDKQSITTTSDDKFKIGENIAATKGKVVYQNELMQLIYYEPILKENYSIPLLIIPAWINKYYILDLSPHNSYIQWLLEQGYSVFMISWVNPSKELMHKNFEDYMKEGVLDALDAIEKATGKKEVNAIGYCLGGTLLACTLSYLKTKKDDRIKSATLFTTLIDFKDAGDLSLFIDEEQLGAMAKKVADIGIFKGSEMGSTFSILRANEMIWSFIVNNYMMGKEPFPFDMLYWNSDRTNLPAMMHMFYLRNMYLENNLTKPGGIKLLDVPIDVRQIDLPLYMISCHDDHIAPWRNTYKFTQMINQKNLRYVLSGSGHVAGVVNHPTKQKYGYWVAQDYPSTDSAWFDIAKQHQGSWWIDWNEWMKPKAGAMEKSKDSSELRLKAIEDAPGSYVRVRSE